MCKLKPLFIFSLPRSGSTLLQRILAAHTDVFTVSEPWILLPYLYTLKNERAFADYAHYGAVNAIKDLYSSFPNGLDDYIFEMREFVLRLYSKAAGDKNYTYFLDKTPRYHLIVEDIIKMFPEGKFIFLWRNPLAIISSLINSMGDNKWILYRYNVDLFLGLVNLIDTFQKYETQLIHLQYEHLLQQPEAELMSIFSYLSLPFEHNVMNDFIQVEVAGGYGDPTGITEYSSINYTPIEKWKSVLNNPFRKHWSKKYLQWLGEQRLAVMGYSYKELIDELQEVPVTSHNLISDLCNEAYGIMFRLFDLRVQKQQFQRLHDLRNLNAHL